MRRLAAVLWLALASSAFGWSEDWDEVPTNDMVRPSGRMFMELVWAVNERVLAARAAAGDHFYDSPGVNVYPIFPESNYLFGDSYICIQTNWSDEIGDYVVTTGALYKGEFWEPSMSQVSDLIQAAYEVFPYFMPAGIETFTNRFAPYFNPTNVDPSVPLWVYEIVKYGMSWQDEGGWHYRTNAYGQREVDIAMHLAWPSNPISILGGRIATMGEDNAIPAYLIDYPVHESPPGTTLTNQILNLFTVTECESPGTPWELVGNVYTNPFGGSGFNARAEYGTHECESLEIVWDGTNGWWTNSTFTFAVSAAWTTNAILYSATNLAAWDFRPDYRFINGGYSIREAYRTNEYEVTGKLPMTIPCTNLVPINVRIASGNLFTAIVPNVVARVKGIRPAGWTYFNNMRGGFADWNPSASRLWKIREIIDLFGSNTLAQATVAETGWTQYTTNSGTFWNDPDDTACEDCVWPVGYGGESSYTNFDYCAYGTWRTRHQAASISAISHVERSSGSFSATRKSFRYCAQVDVGSDYVSARLPDADGFPYISSCDFYISTITNMDGSIYSYITNSRTFYGTATFSATSEVGSDINGYHLIDTNLTFNGDYGWLTELNDLTAQSWIDGPYSCSGGTNLSHKTVDTEIAFNVSGIAHWQFSTNFDAYWDMYPACTNIP